MAAQTQVLSFHGVAPGTGVDKQGQNVRHKRNDDDNVDLADPIPIPATGTAYGWRKHTKLNFTTSPAGQCSNLYWFMQPLPVNEDPARGWDGVSIYAGTKTTYTRATVADEAGLISGLTDCDVTPFYNVGNPLVVVSGVFIGNTTGVGTQPFVVTQVSVNTSALGGEKDPRAALYRFTEV